MYENERKWGKHIQDAEHLAEESQKYPLAFTKKEISDTKRETGRKILAEQFSSF